MADVVRGIEVEPARSAAPRIDALDVRDLDEEEPGRPQRDAQALECRARLREVLDHVPGANGVESLRLELGLLQESRPYVDAEALARLAREVRRRLDAGDFEARFPGLVEEMTGCGANLENPAALEEALDQPEPDARFVTSLGLVLGIGLAARILLEVLVAV